MTKEAKRISIYFLAGIGTWQRGDMFGQAKTEMTKRFQDTGYDVIYVKDLYPYGTMDNVPDKLIKRTVLRQAFQVFRDLNLKYWKTSGGCYVYDNIQEDYLQEDGGQVVLIGHSGGGVAAYSAAQMLEDAGRQVSHIVMVGTPDQPIKKAWQNRVLYLEQAGWIGDLVTWWGFSGFRAPRAKEKVNVVGGHPFYFCPVQQDQKGISNLSKVIDKIWHWVWPSSG